MKLMSIQRDKIANKIRPSYAVIIRNEYYQEMNMNKFLAAYYS